MDNAVQLVNDWENTPSTLPFSPLPLGFSPQIKKTKLKMNGGRTNTQAVKSLNCIFRLHFTAEPVVIFRGGKIRESK